MVTNVSRELSQLKYFLRKSEKIYNIATVIIVCCSLECKKTKERKGRRGKDDAKQSLRVDDRHDEL